MIFCFIFTLRKEKTLRDLLRQTVGFNPFPKKITEEQIQDKMHEANELYKVNSYISDSKKAKSGQLSRLRGG